MKTTRFMLQGQTFYLCLNAAALFELYDRFPDAEGVSDPLLAPGANGFKATCTYLAVLSLHGELVRRYAGCDKGPVRTEEWFMEMLSPLDAATARMAIFRAINLGLGREVPDEEDQHEDGAIDLGLQELKAKKAAPASHGRNIWRALRAFFI